MTKDPVELSVLTDARTRLVDTVVRQMPERHREFLMSFERGEPRWDLLTAGHVAELPAVQWRMRNLASIGEKRRRQLVEALEKVLEP
jgi:hypothetical protein